ncbi:hypothetical protein [Candidatus Thiosymbion oneisti]|uniref:hypothetical protein n=1 Tax=Candidatus Thiosymbion oneisti TaxID=589554 RepID=UPI000B7CB610|nr:hypothetical protein [Candidatus Thiosymbion oneisti]
MTIGKPTRILLHLFTGGIVSLTAILIMLRQIPGWEPVQTLVLAAGSGIIALGFVPNLGFVSRASTDICLSILSLFTILTLCEGFFRIIEFDFAPSRERAWRKTPTYYRKPTVPTGEVFFRRPGPQTWTGQVRNTVLIQNNIEPNPYNNEPVITVKYNKLGFRNPDDLSDWEIAVAGDSFVELGYLRYEELFTTILGNILNKRVLNLGTSYTGPLTQLSYLRDYGISSSTKHTVIVFFEGNDLGGLAREYEALTGRQASGQRNYREFKRQTSLAKAFYELLRNSVRSWPGPIDLANAHFKSPHGDIPVTLTYTPPAKSEISAENIQQLNYFFSGYASFGIERQTIGWIAYMPSKRRILDGQLRFNRLTDERFRSWQPSDLPELISELCDQYGIRFIDLTPDLVEETRNKGHLVYNSIYDTHLNSVGSLVVARVMAKHLATQGPRSPDKALQPTR